MARYPGGTPHDPTTHGYSVLNNFMSDLGMTVAYDGRPNRLGAALFIFTLCAVVAGLTWSLVVFLRMCEGSAESRPYTQMARLVGALVAALYIGVALTPENRVMGLHLQFTLWAFRIFPIGTVLLAVASRKSRFVPNDVVVGWALLSVILIAYVIILDWGPRLSTSAGLTTQVVAQKVVAFAIMSFFYYLCLRLERTVFS
jgi:hypothetical membrane protein